MGSRNANLFYFIGDDQFDLALPVDWLVKLGNLITLRQVRVKIIFSIEFAEFRDPTIQSQSHHYGLFHRFHVDYRQSAWLTRANFANMNIWFCRFSVAG